jgi:branched-chain amino acid transport system substrate-binding protein
MSAAGGMRVGKDRFSNGEFRVGGIFPMTGYLSWSGQYKRKAAELKIEIINEAGGIKGRPLRLIAYDDQSSPEQAARLAEALICKDRVTALVGTGSLPVSGAVARVANRYRVPAFISSGYAIDPVQDRFVFNTAHKTEFAIACAFQYFLERGINRIALLMPQGSLGELGSLFGRRIADQLGMRIVGEERFDVRSPEVTPQLGRLGSLKPQALFSFVTGQPAVLVVRRMAELGLHIPLLVSHGNANPVFLKLVSRIPVPLIVPSGKTMLLDSVPAWDPGKNIVTDFNARHAQRYGEPANYCSAELADAIDLVAAGLRAAGAQPVELRDAVENMRRFEGMQGVYDLSPIDHYGTHLEHVVLLTIKDGTWHFAKAFSSITHLEDCHANQKTRLISRLGDLLSDPASLGLVNSDHMLGIRTLPEVQNSSPSADPKPDPYFLARLYFREKWEMMQAVREEDAVKAKQSLHRLLTVALMHHFETLEPLKVSILELFLALFDTALDQGADLEELARLKHDFTLEWKDVRNEETLCLWIVRALNTVIDTVSGTKRGGDAGLLKNVFRFIEANYADDLKVERIAREVALSPSRLIHRMRSQYGLTLGDCVVKVRMEKAQTLLRNTDMPIGKIAHDVGYKDQSYFTRVFKKSTQCTPKVFRDSTFKVPVRRG